MSRKVVLSALMVAVALATAGAPAVRASETEGVAPSASRGPAPSPTPRPLIENVGVATKTTIYGDEIRATNAQNTYDAIKNVPGAVQADAKASGGADNLQLRGIHLGSSTGYRFDGGLSMLNNIVLSPEDKDQVQVLKGAGALEYGLTSPAGVINYVLKRATTTPVNAVSFSANNFGQAIFAVDVGRKFGSNNQFGIRVNAAQGDIGSYTFAAGGTRWLSAVTADYKGKRASVQVDFENFGLDVIENATILQNKPGTNGVIVLPKIPDPHLLYSGVWAKNVGIGENFAVRGNYQFSPNVSLLAEAAHSESQRLQRRLNQIGTYNVTTGLGTDTVTLIRDQIFTNIYGNIEMKVDAKFGTFATNSLSFGFNRNARLFNNPSNGSATFKQNIYTPIVLPAPAFPTTPITYQPQNSADYDYFFHDSLRLFERVHVTGGIRRIYYEADNTQTNGKNNHSNYSFSSPGLGAVVDVTKHLALYGSYVKSLEETGSAPANSANAFSILPPAPASQQEVGMRTIRTRGFAMTFGYFTITRANATTDPTTNIFALNGTNTFEGLESNMSLDLARGLNVKATGQFMSAVQRSPGDPTINGKIPENTPRLTGTLALNYRPSFFRGVSFNGEMLGFGSRQINPQNQGTLPALTLFNAGANFNVRRNNERYTVTVSVKNVADKRYWSSANNGALGIGPPRTVTLTVRAGGQ